MRNAQRSTHVRRRMRQSLVLGFATMLIVAGVGITGGDHALAAPPQNSGGFRQHDPHATNQMQPPGKLSARAQAVAAVTGTPSAAPSGPAWSFLGPQPISNEKCCGTSPASNFGATSGRVTSLVVDPTNAAVAYAGSAGGGVWKTTDSGTTWSALTDAQPAHAVGAMAIDATGQIIYAATGEDNGPSSDQQYGLGILKSTNGGSTWTLLSGTQFSGHIGGIAIDRTTSGSTQHVIAATSGGIYRSTDAGATWTHVFTTKGTFDVVQDPSTASKFWATAGDEYSGVCDAAVLVSTDGGATWTSNHAPASSGRISIGVGSGGVAYAAVSDCNWNLASIDKTTTGGTSWTSIKSSGTPSLTNYFNASSSGQGQAWYDNTVGVDPTNAAHAVFGGVDLLATSNGGTSFTAVGKVYTGGVVHADFHAFAFSGANTFYVGNDGGVWHTSDLGGTGTASDWTDLNNALGISQFYSGAATDATHFFGGTQDNGSAGNFGGSPALPSMPEYHGGDGFFTAIDPGSSTIYAEYGQGFIERGSSTINASDPNSPYDSFVSAGPCQVTSDPACSDNVDFIAPFAMDGNNSSHLVAATSHVYETTDGGVPAGKSSWPQISPDLTTGLSGDDLTALTLVPGTETMFTGSMLGAVHMTTNGTTWTTITGNLPQPTSNPEAEGVPWIAQIAYNPANTQELWLGLGDPYSSSNNVYHTTNAGSVSGTTWSDISGSGGTALSQGPVLGMAADPNHPGTVYAGTQFGVFVCTTCGGTSPAPSWSDTGLPWVQVRQLTVSHDNSTLFAWTHGRGVWSRSIVAAPTVTAVSPSSGTGTSATTITITGTNLASVTQASFGSNATFAVTHDATTPNTKLYVANPGSTNPAGGTVDVTVTGPGGTSATSSADQYTFSPWGYLRITTPSGGLPSQISVDGNYQDTWGTTWVHTDTGSHQVCFSDVQGWTTPSCSTVAVTQGATTSVTGAFAQRGFLQVQESPAGVDGTVSVDGNPMDDYGMYTDLPAGSHQVCFSAVANYTPPVCQNISVTAGATTMVTGAYTSNPGASGQSGTGLLRVTTNPPLPSQISVDGIARDTWGLDWLQLAAGTQTHSVCFSGVQGYTAPACSMVTITAGQTTTVQGNFTQRGFLQVQESPAGVDGVVSVDGIARDDYGMFTDVPAGSHTVCWGAVSAKTAPACQTVNVTAGASTLVTGAYT